MLLDYGMLKLIWWGFIFALFLLFFIFGGRDFGVCTLLPLIGKSDSDKRMLINSIGPTWEGNQVWFVTAGGALFAAWPIVYATSFSALYIALFVVLATLIVRPPGFDFRSKLANQTWRNVWDACLFLSGVVPALIFGVALGNLFLGLPFRLDEILHSSYEGSFFGLLHPFCLLFGLASVTLLTMHGGLYLQKKLPEEYHCRVKKWIGLSAWSFIVIFVALGAWIVMGIKGFAIDSAIDINAELIPTAKEVSRISSWLTNYQQYPFLWALPGTTLSAVLLAFLLSRNNCMTLGIVASTLAIATSLLTAAIALFPFILPSSVEPNHSLTVWDATSSHLTLHHLFFVAVIFLPIVLGYTLWVFRVLTGRMNKDVLDKVESY